MRQSKSMCKNWLSYWRQKSQLTMEHEKAAWGSPASQISRFKAVTRLLLKDKPKVVLDIGCGTGEFEHWFRQHINNCTHFLAFDFSPQHIDQARMKQVPHCLFQVLDATDMPFETGQFPYAIMIGVLQNCSMPYQILAEASRVTKKKLIVTTLSQHAPHQNPVNTYYNCSDLVSKLVSEHHWRTVQVYGLDTQTGQLVSPRNSHVMLLDCSR